MNFRQVLFGVLLIAVSVGLFMVVKLPPDLVDTTAFSNEYPVNGSWNSTGALFGDATDNNGVLTLTTTATSGSYISDPQLRGQDNDVLFLTFASDVDNVDSGASVEMIMRGLDDEVVVAQETYMLEEGENLIDNRAFRNQSFDSYEFELQMSSDSNDIPRVNMITITGDVRPDTSFLKLVLFIIFVMTGFYYTVKGLI